MRYLFLLFLKAVSHTLFRHETRWLSPTPEPPWKDLRLVVFLHHTSLYEWLFVAAAPNHLLGSVARRAVIPIAQKTFDRPLVGSFYRFLAPQLVPISREPDHTWDDVMSRVDARSMVIIAPEGRMMRGDGLDKNGRPMTVRGGVADMLRAIDGGTMLLAYSGGLHHVQVPGEGFPKLFRDVRMALELVDIDEYKSSLGVDSGAKAFKRAVKNDMERRRDQLRPPDLPAEWPSRASDLRTR